MKALLISMGTRGDIEPFLAVAEVLSQKDWEIVCLFPEQFRGDVEELGYNFYGFSADFLKLIDGADAKRILGGERSLMRRVKSWFTLARKGMKLARESVRLQHRVQLNENPDRVIYHPKCFTAIVWGMANPGKSIMLCPIPGLAHPVDHFSVMWGNHGRALNRLVFWLMNTIKSVTVKRYTAEFMGDFPGLRVSASSIKQAIEHTEKTLYTVFPSLFPKPSYWPDTAHVVGYFERDKTSHWVPSADLKQFIDAHEKIVFISFGSMTSSAPAAKTATILNALKKHGIPAIIGISGGGLERSADVPEHVIFVDSAPYDWLFPQVYSVVHHGGSGTTHTAIKYGCPSFVIWHALDQPFWSRTVSDHKLGPVGLPLRKLDDGHLEEKLLDLYTNEEYTINAVRFSELIAQESDRDSLYRLIIS